MDEVLIVDEVGEREHRSPAKRTLTEAARISRIFGDDLAERIGDEQTFERPSDRGEESSDDWLRAQRPPHHG